MESEPDGHLPVDRRLPLDETLGRAFIDNDVKHRVLGVRLQPLSLWHRFLLLAIDSPYLRAGTAHLIDLQRAVGVCRLLYPHSHIRRPFPAISLLRRGFSGENDAFLSYAGDYLARPIYDIVPPDRGDLPERPVRHSTPAPEIFRVVCDIIGWTKWPEDHAWNLPLCKANWYRMGAQRAMGLDVDFLDEAEREFQEGFRQELAAGEHRQRS